MSLRRLFVRLGQTVVSYFCRDGRKGCLLVLLITASLWHRKPVSWACSMVFSSSARAPSHLGEMPPVLLLKIYWQLHCIWSNFGKYHSVQDTTLKGTEGKGMYLVIIQRYSIPRWWYFIYVVWEPTEIRCINVHYSCTWESQNVQGWKGPLWVI